MAKIKVPFETAEESSVFLELEVPDRNLVHSFVPEEPPKLPDVASAACTQWNTRSKANHSPSCLGQELRW